MTQTSNSADPPRPADPPAATGPVGHLTPERLVLWVAAVALLVRLPHLVEVVSSAFFGVPILDEAFYDLAARRLAGGLDLGELNPGFRPLLYPGLVALLYGLAGPFGHLLVLTAQHGLGVLTTLLVARYAADLTGRRSAGLVAGCLYALAGPPLFYEGRLLITTLFTFLVMAWLSVLGACGDRLDTRRWLPWCTAGLLLAVAVQARPNALVLAIALLLPLAWSTGSRRTALGLVTISLGSLGLGLVTAGALQAPAVGRFQVLPSAGGVNLYLGNERGADGMVPRQDRHASYGDEYRDSVQLFARQEYLRQHPEREPGTVRPAEISRYWLHRSADEITAAPGRWLGLMARKAWLLVWPTEVPNNLSYDFVARHETPILGWMPVRWAWLLPLAVAGLVMALSGGVADGRVVDGRVDRRRLGWLLAVGALHAASVVVFFVAGRYRIPLWPLAAILASVALTALPSWPAAWRAGRRRPIVAAVAAALAVFAVGQIPWPGVALPSAARDHFFRSVALFEKGRTEEALADAQRAVDLEPSSPAALFQLGTVALELERWDRAAAALFTASQLLPDEPRPLNNLGIALEHQGMVGEAYAAYTEAIRRQPTHSAAWVNAALLELRAGRTDLAGPRIERAAELERAAGGAPSVPLLCARAFWLRDTGQDAAFRQAWKRALERDERAARSLWADNQRRLKLEDWDKVRAERQHAAGPPASAEAPGPAEDP